MKTLEEEVCIEAFYPIEEEVNGVKTIDPNNVSINMSVWGGSFYANCSKKLADKVELNNHYIALLSLRSKLVQKKNGYNVFTYQVTEVLDLNEVDKQSSQVTVTT